MFFGHTPLLLQLKIISGLTPCCKKAVPYTPSSAMCVCSSDSHLCVGDKWLKEVIDHKTQQIHCYCGTTGHAVLVLGQYLGSTNETKNDCLFSLCNNAVQCHITKDTEATVASIHGRRNWENDATQILNIWNLVQCVKMDSNDPLMLEFRMHSHTFCRLSWIALFFLYVCTCVCVCFGCYFTQHFVSHLWIYTFNVSV